MSSSNNDTDTSRWRGSKSGSLLEDFGQSTDRYIIPPVLTSPYYDRNFEMGHHPSKLGHELSADLLTSWFNEQLCKAPFVKSLENFPGRMELDLPADPSPVRPRFTSELPVADVSL
jgi:hypothetical protein